MYNRNLRPSPNIRRLIIQTKQPNLKNNTLLFDPTIKTICFDAFGTLVEIKDKRRSHAALIRHLTPRNRARLKHVIMREPLTIDACLDSYAPNLDASIVETLKTDLAAEIASITNRIWD